MAVYLVLITMPDEGKKSGEDYAERIKETSKVMDYLGVKTLVQYAILGPYDFVNIVEAPDNETILRISLELGSRGTVNIISMPAMQTDNLVSTIRIQRAKR